MAGTLFVLPGFLSILALSVLYAGWGETFLVAAVFYGVKPAVLAIVLDALVRIGRRAIAGRAMPVVAATAFVAIFFFDVPFPMIVGAAALIGWLGGRFGTPAFLALTRPGEDEPVERLDRLPLGRTLATAALWLTVWWAPVGALAVVADPGGVFVDEAIFFSKTAVVTFGGAYAVLAYIAQRAVEDFGWLAPGEMLDGLGMAETTPGPLIQVVQFVGFMGAYRNPGALDPMLAGVIGSLVTTWVTFAPCFLWIFVGAPYVEHLRGRESLTAALSAITAAVVGVILNLALWFAIQTLFAETVPFARWGTSFDLPIWSTIDPIATAIAAGAMVALFWLRWGMPAVLALAAVAGLVARLVA